MDWGYDMYKGECGLLAVCSGELFAADMNLYDCPCINVYDAADGTLLREIAVPECLFPAFALSPYGWIAVLTRFDAEIQCYDLEGEELGRCSLDNAMTPARFLLDVWQRRLRVYSKLPTRNPPDLYVRLFSRLAE
jgi:hypothetical protein